MNGREQYEAPVLESLGDLMEVTEATSMGGGVEDGATKTVSGPTAP